MDPKDPGLINLIGLILSAFSALAVLIGSVAALVTTAFIAGLLIGQARRPPP